MKFIKILIIACLFINFVACENATTEPQTQEILKDEKIISLSGFTTGLLYDLGYGKQLVGVDVTSVYPVQANQLPKLGHISQLNAEAILALEPTVIFMEKMEQTPEAITQLEKAGVKIVAVPTSPYLYNAVNAANAIKKVINVPTENVKKLQKSIEADSLQLAKALETVENKPKVLFIYARGAGSLSVGGKKTKAAALIEKAGGVNAIQSFDDYETLTPESLIEGAPDAILMFKSGLASLDGKSGLAQIPGISQTPAFKNDKIITIDGHYSLFGSEVSQGAIEIAKQLYEIE